MTLPIPSRRVPAGLLLVVVALAGASGCRDPETPSAGTLGLDGDAHSSGSASGGGTAPRDPHPHAPRDIEAYVARLESPERVAELRVDRVIEELDLAPDDTVADLGSGPGVFALPLGRALPEGLVYAVDVEPRQLDALRRRLREAGLRNVVPVLAGLDDPFLPPGRIDLVLVVDTYHHIAGRSDYFRRLRGALAPGGRLAIVEWKPGELPMGPPPGHKGAEGERARELRAAGWVRVERFDLHELHDFEIWRPRGPAGEG